MESNNVLILYIAGGYVLGRFVFEVLAAIGNEVFRDHLR
jgi:hypothetical protein